MRLPKTFDTASHANPFLPMFHILGRQSISSIKSSTLSSKVNTSSPTISPSTTMSEPPHMTQRGASASGMHIFDILGPSSNIS
ncbi:hypothetical protein TMatcc_001047 [Talaromyces marneffei ATCC 18224]